MMGKGYGGGPGQLSHLAPTYSAIAALVELETDEAWAAIDRCGSGVALA